MAPDAPRPPGDDKAGEYSDLLADAFRGEVAGLLERADELERAQTQEEERRRELEAKLASGRADRPMVPVREWVRNPYFVGNLASDERGGLFPKLKEDLEDIFDGRGGLGYFEVVIGGASGYGKTSGLMRSIFLRCLYEVSCLASPQRGLSERAVMDTDSILFVNYSFKEENARATLYTYIMRDVDSIPYFKEFYPRDPKFTKELRFPRGVIMRPGITTDTGATGENLLVAALDEANKYPLVQHSDRVRSQGEVYDVADKLHGQCFNRQRNRFMRPGGEMPRAAKLLVGCSAQYPEDYVERRTELALAAGKLTHAVKVVRYPEWGTKPRSYYQLPWVDVAVSADGAAEVLDGDVAAERRVELESRGWSVHPVPGEHVPSFREQPELSVRELLGIATKAIEPFMRKRETIVAAVEARRVAAAGLGIGAAGTAHPFTVVETTLRDAAGFIREYLCARDPADPTEWRPRVSPGAVRYAHFDLSENKCGTGFCVGHVFDVRQIARSKREDDGGPVQRVDEWAPWIWPDIYLRIVAPKDEQVDYAACRSLVFELSTMGFRFGMLSWDQWNSVDSRQRMEEKGYQVGLVSMDRDSGAYSALRTALYEGRILLYDYEPLMSELAGVEMVRGKVVPGRGNTKDVADALAAVVQHCETLGMSAREWSNPDARMVLAPFGVGAGAGEPDLRSPIPGVPRSHLEAFGMPQMLDDEDRAAGFEADPVPRVINTGTYKRGERGADNLLTRRNGRR